MALETINLGNVANDGTGDNLREAFRKVNANFALLEVETADVTGTNLGTIGSRVFKESTNNNMSFRRLVAGTNVQLNETANTIEVSVNPVGNIVVSGDSGSLLATPGSFFNIRGGTGITVGVNENTKTITVTGGLITDTTPTLSTNLNANGKNIVNLNKINGIDWETQMAPLFHLDFGSMPNTITNMLDFILKSTTIDLGSITAPATYVIDLGPTESFLQ